MRVRAGSVYIYKPVGMDLYSPANLGIAEGQKVRVVNLYGCPKANTMGHCHVNDANTGVFLGLVLCNSLTREGL
jgi:hypothetical protein